MPQSSITQFPEALANGTAQGTGEHEVYSKVIEGAITVPLGYLVLRGTNADQVVLPAAAFTLAQVAGFALFPNTKEKLLSDPDGTVEFVQFDQIGAAEDGLFAIKCRTAFTAGTTGFGQHTLNAGINPGELTGLTTANNSAVNVIFESTGIADDIALVRISKQA